MHLSLLFLLACGRPSASERPTPPAAPALPAPPPVAAELRFEGICDGSAAVVLDDGRLLIADDESTALFAGRPGQPVISSDPLEGTLGLRSSAEFDLEGAAREDRQAWWMGSHGRDAEGEPAPNRQLLFATTLPATDLSDLRVERGPFNLLPLLQDYAPFASLLAPEAWSAAPKAGGISLEGLALHPQGGLVVGLRSPLTGPGGQTGDALLLRLQADGHGMAITELHRLPLGDRGVRSIEQDGDGFLLIAGPPGEGGGDFALFRWDGKAPTAQPLDLDLGTLRPEGLVRDAQGWLLLSDDGEVERPDPEAKDGARTCKALRKKGVTGPARSGVYFRALRLPLD